MYRLAHVTMTSVVGARTAGREEGMVKVQLGLALGLKGSAHGLAIG